MGPRPPGKCEMSTVPNREGVTLESEFEKREGTSERQSSSLCLGSSLLVVLSFSCWVTVFRLTAWIVHPNPLVSDFRAGCPAVT